jgi:hypothetical protein
VPRPAVVGRKRGETPAGRVDVEPAVRLDDG